MGEISKVVGQWIANNVPWAVLIGVFIFCLFFEISKIKVYPLKWLWKLISWPFKKIDEQRTESFKAIAAELKIDIDNKLAEMQTSSNANCDTVKSCFVDLNGKFAELEARFDALDTKQAEADEKLDKMKADRIKNHVFNFARQIRNGEKHSHEEFMALMKEHEQYEALVAHYTAIDEKHKKSWKNDVYPRDYKTITDAYDRGEFYE